ncbi:MAG: hypothetical protein XXXJIFNMEKO3_02206 [Candidatus Erwinia impunctatus]|nr:hypothetical protein XXXJIFNMEKO_02206 [Culicoides impunctatus]
MLIRVQKFVVFLSVAIAFLVSGAAQSASVETPSGYASATVIRAVQKQDRVEVELRFETDVDGYSGESIYHNPSDASWNDDFYIEVNGKSYPLARSSAGERLAPDSLALTFCYNTKKNPRVGSWQATFTAPTTPINQITLSLANLPLIKGVVVKNAL